MKGKGSGALEILLVTSRRTRRWIIPKGNIDFHMAPHAAAAQEALEEAGAVGEIGKRPLGVFRYRKSLMRGFPVVAKVSVFPLEVVSLLDKWPECAVRKRRWFPRDAAADAVEEPQLSDIIRAFRP